MQAGDGADEQAARHQRRLERLRAEHALAATEESARALRSAEGLVHAWTTGADGERQVADTLLGLADRGWTALHDVRWPGRPQANLDHVALGPGGVVVVDAKNWNGTVTVRDGELRQNGYRRDEAVEGVAAATAAVTAMLAPQHRTAARGVLCLAGQGQGLEPVVLASGVTVVGRAHLVAHLATLGPRLDPYEVADIGRHLGGQLDRPVRAAHTGMSPAPRPAGRASRRRPTTAPSSRAPRRSPRPRPSRRRRLVAGLLQLGLTIAAVMFLLNVLPTLLGAMTSQLTEGLTPTPAATAVPVEVAAAPAP
ncbi:nuclease-related domain-containing protein [Cellulomonas marina]|uniref:Nuclease-related domain-containing protein n=1 Tax=Cellulomonas marina TaxID=988821 RepID=A0A1I0Y5E3_9CELL|nr:nuclease-related domain-containing protein [Cellulomonas marina]SFB08635.1 Nuclease-related domain-containing protein [Cellulomonas marina]